MIPNLRSTVHPIASLGPELVARWAQLVLSGPRPAAFMGPTFAMAATSAGFDTRVCVIRSGQEPIGFFPFQFADPVKRGLRAAERIGGGMADHAGLVGVPDLRLDANALLRLAGLCTFTFTNMPEAQQAFGLLGTDPRIGLRIEFPEGPTAYWAERRKADVSLVRDTERRRRKLEQDVGGIRYVYQAQSRVDTLEQLIDAKRAQYERTGAGDPLRGEANRMMLRALVDAESPDCTSVLSTLHAGETWVALHFGLRCGDTLHYWFPVYNPALSKYSPGRLLLLETINESERTGLRAIDRGEGDTQAKRDFATSEQVFLRGRWERPGLRSMINRGIDSLRWRIEGKRN